MSSKSLTQNYPSKASYNDMKHKTILTTEPPKMYIHRGERDLRTYWAPGFASVFIETTMVNFHISSYLSEDKYWFDHVKLEGFVFLFVF